MFAVYLSIITMEEIENAREVLKWLQKMQSLVAESPLNAEMIEQSPYLHGFVVGTQEAVEASTYHRMGIMEQYIKLTEERQ